MNDSSADMYLASRDRDGRVHNSVGSRTRPHYIQAIRRTNSPFGGATELLLASSSTRRSKDGGVQRDMALAPPTDALQHVSSTSATEDSQCKRMNLRAKAR